MDQIPMPIRTGFRHPTNQLTSRSFRLKPLPSNRLTSTTGGEFHTGKKKTHIVAAPPKWSIDFIP